MNRIIESHLAGFKTTYGLQDLDETHAFEHFLNFSVGYKHTGTPPDTSAITTDDPDAGIDGVLFLIDNELVTTVDECLNVIQRSKRNVDAKLLFTQACVTEGFTKAKITTFGSGVFDFLQKKPNQPHGQVLKEHHRIFEAIVKNASKIVGGKPECEIYYASTGRYNKDTEIEAAIKTTVTQLQTLGLFTKIEPHVLDCDSLLKLWLDCTQTIGASVDVVGQMISLPKSSKVQEAYFGLVLGRELVEKLLMNEDGELRTWVFNENVRSFLGGDSAVNADIVRTLSAAETRVRFALLNNGITIVSPDIRVQGNTISLNGYQIVNGCQTSNVLFLRRDVLGDEVAVAVKFIEADDPDVVAEIVRATNKQTKVEDAQFLALEPLTKRIEEYFRTYTQDEQRIYFERRFRQYVGTGIPQLRIFDIKSACRAVSAMFLNRPDLAMRYPNQMFVELRDRLFDGRNKEIVYYAACLGLYRINLLISGGRLPSNFRRMKWHLLNAARVAVGGSKVPLLSSREIEKYCKSLISVFSTANPLSNKDFARAVEHVKTISDSSRNHLTKKTAANEIQIALVKKTD